MDVVKKQMESLGIEDPKLMKSFSTNKTVIAQMKTDNRVPPPYTVSPIEKITERYGLTIEGIISGIATTYQSRTNMNFVPKKDFTDKKTKRTADIQFSVTYLQDKPSVYPAPKRIPFKYSLTDEN